MPSQQPQIEIANSDLLRNRELAGKPLQVLAATAGVGLLGKRPWSIENFKIVLRCEGTPEARCRAEGLNNVFMTMTSKTFGIKDGPIQVRELIDDTTGEVVAATERAFIYQAIDPPEEDVLTIEFRDCDAERNLIATAEFAVRFDGNAPVLFTDEA
jgi:hypothetical protein